MSSRLLKRSSSPPLYAAPASQPKRVSQWEDGDSFDDLLPILTPAKKPRTKNSTATTTSPPKSSPRRSTLPRRVASSSTSTPRQPATPSASPRPSPATKSCAPRPSKPQATAHSEDEEDVLVLASPAGASIFAPPPLPPRAAEGKKKSKSPQRPPPAVVAPTEAEADARSPALPSPSTSQHHSPPPTSPDISAFLASLPLPFMHLYPTFVALGCTSSSDLLALASETEMGRATRKVLLDLVQEESGGGTATVEMEEVRMQLVGIAERVLDVVKLVGRKRKSEEGTLWGEVERTKKRMDGFEELRTRMEGLEQETRERDDGMTEATHSLLAPPPLPSPPTQILGR